jgi:hypothetical protein
MPLAELTDYGGRAMRSWICLLVLVLAAAACGGASDDEAAPVEESTPTTTATTEPPTTTESTEPEAPDPPIGETEPQTEAEAAAGSGGLLDYSLIPGPDGSMISETITFSADGETVALTFDLIVQTAVEYEDDTAVCFEQFSVKGTAEDLPLVEGSVTGPIDLIFEFAEPTQCPDTIQSGMGIPQTVEVLGEIEGSTLTGMLDFGPGLPFVAVEG